MRASLLIVLGLAVLVALTAHAEAATVSILTDVNGDGELVIPYNSNVTLEVYVSVDVAGNYTLYLSVWDHVSKPIYCNAVNLSLPVNGSTVLYFDLPGPGYTEGGYVSVLLFNASDDPWISAPVAEQTLVLRHAAWLVQSTAWTVNDWDGPLDLVSGLAVLSDVEINVTGYGFSGTNVDSKSGLEFRAGLLGVGEARVASSPIDVEGVGAAQWIAIAASQPPWIGPGMPKHGIDFWDPWGWALLGYEDGAWLILNEGPYAFVTGGDPATGSFTVLVTVKQIGSGSEYTVDGNISITFGVSGVENVTSYSIFLGVPSTMSIVCPPGTLLRGADYYFNETAGFVVLPGSASRAWDCVPDVHYEVVDTTFEDTWNLFMTMALTLIAVYVLAVVFKAAEERPGMGQQ